MTNAHAVKGGEGEDPSIFSFVAFDEAKKQRRMNNFSSNLNGSLIYLVSGCYLVNAQESLAHIVNADCGHFYIYFYFHPFFVVH